MSKTLFYGATKVDGSTAVSSLEPSQWKNRVVIIFADANNARASRQENLWLAERECLAERDLIVLRVEGDMVSSLFGAADALDANLLRTDLEAPEAGIFAAILVGKDGSVKLRAVEPITCDELFATIDGMPMRAAETTRLHDLQAILSQQTEGELMSLPQDPKTQPPMPAPGWKPEPPIVEPEPDSLPDEVPLPNPDENDGPPMQV